jgi:hypothetical protein
VRSYQRRTCRHSACAISQSHQRCTHHPAHDGGTRDVRTGSKSARAVNRLWSQQSTAQIPVWRESLQDESHASCFIARRCRVRTPAEGAGRGTILPSTHASSDGSSAVVADRIAYRHPLLSHSIVRRVVVARTLTHAVASIRVVATSPSRSSMPIDVRWKEGRREEIETRSSGAMRDSQWSRSVESEFVPTSTSCVNVAAVTSARVHLPTSRSSGRDEPSDECVRLIAMVRRCLSRPHTIRRMVARVNAHHEWKYTTVNQGE